MSAHTPYLYVAPLPRPFDLAAAQRGDWSRVVQMEDTSEEVMLSPDDVAFISRQWHYGGSIGLTGSGELAVEIVDAVDEVDQPCPILFQQHVCGFPRGYNKQGEITDPKQWDYKPMSLALTEAHDHDAHTHGYSLSSLRYRLRKPIVTDCPEGTAEIFQWVRTAVPMRWMFWDIDDPMAHKQTMGDAALPEARPEWREMLAVRLRRIDAVHPGMFTYDTKRGARFMYRVVGWTITSPEDGDRWNDYVLQCHRYIERTFDMGADVCTVDPCSKHWWNEFRLPKVKRGDGQATRALLTSGYPAAIGVWTYVPTAEDVANDTEAPKRRKKRVDPSTYKPADPNAKDELIDRAGRVGLIRNGGKTIDVGAGKYAIVCPNHRKHSSGGGGDGDTSTVIWRGGPLHCSHAHCLEVGRVDLERLVRAREARVVPLEGVEAAVHGAIDSATPGGCVVVVVTPGGGKSHGLRSSRQMRSTRGPSVLCDTHNLVTQTRDRLLADHGLDFKHEASVSAAIPGRAPCIFPKEVAEVQRAGLPVGQFACAKCPEKKTCEARKGIGGSDGLVSVYGLVGKAPEDRLILVDEEPPFTETKKITRETVERASKALQLCDRDFVDAVGPWVRLWAKALDDASALEDASGYEFVRQQADMASAAPDRNLAAKRNDELAPVELDANGFGPLLHGQGVSVTATKTAGLPLNRAWLKDASALAAVRFAAKKGAKITATKDGWIVRVVSPVLEALGTTSMSAPGRVLFTATPTLTVLRKVLPGLKVLELAVPDRPGVTRTVVEVADLQTGKADIGRITKYVDTALGAARAASCSRPLVVVAKKFVEAVQSHVGAGVHVAHFGALRGLDDWIACDAFITIGDHFQNKLDVEAEAAFFGVDSGAMWIERVENELAQAHGRARDPSRKGPAHHWHFGKIWPRGWTLENTDVQRGPKGRPKADVGDVEELIKVHGSVAKAAAAAGVTERTLLRRRRAGAA